MIRRIFSDLPRFKELSFRPGLNLVLADKSPGATDRQTRNGAGKTSLVELIHFLMGGNCEKDSIFRLPELLDHSFGMEVDLGGFRATVVRSGKEPSKLAVSGETDHWPVSPKPDRSNGMSRISNTNWKTVLARLLFGLTEDDESEGKNGPTFRSVFPYFARRQSNGGFGSPVQHSDTQQLCGQQVAVSFLLGLDWTIPQAWQAVLDREKELITLKKSFKSGTLTGAVIGSSAELRTQLTLAEERRRVMRERVDAFKVLEEYHELEAEASGLTRRLNGLANDNTIDRQLLQELEESLASEVLPPPENLADLYRQAGIDLPGTALRRFEEVRAFHESVVSNRQDYLTQEIRDVGGRLKGREVEQRAADNRRAEIMGILDAHGALQQYSLLQAEMTRLENDTAALRQSLSIAETLEGGKTELEIERAKLLTRLRQDYHEQEATLRTAILTFGEISEALYETPGSLTVTPGINGPAFDVNIHAVKSKGIRNRQIFCFDQMVARLYHRR